MMSFAGTIPRVVHTIKARLYIELEALIDDSEKERFKLKVHLVSIINVMLHHKQTLQSNFDIVIFSSKRNQEQIEKLLVSTNYFKQKDMLDFHFVKEPVVLTELKDYSNVINHYEQEVCPAYCVQLLSTQFDYKQLDITLQDSLEDKTVEIKEFDYYELDTFLKPPSNPKYKNISAFVRPTAMAPTRTIDNACWSSQDMKDLDTLPLPPNLNTPPPIVPTRTIDNAACWYSQDMKNFDAPPPMEKKESTNFLENCKWGPEFFPVALIAKSLLNKRERSYLACYSNDEAARDLLLYGYAGNFIITKSQLGVSYLDVVYKTSKGVVSYYVIEAVEGTSPENRSLFLYKNGEKQPITDIVEYFSQLAELEKEQNPEKGLFRRK